jgi:DNA invertase Pin-like site-specific DNA recombinase
MPKQKAVAYYRVSTAQQGLSGLGLEAQRAAVLGYLGQGSFDLLEEFTEIESGRIKERPQLQRAIALCRKHKARLVIAKLDRLARNAAFLLALRDSGVDFVAADLPNADRLTVGVMAIFAEHERDMIAKRTREALQAAKARGIKLGNPRIADASALGASANKARASEFADNVMPIIEQIRRSGLSSLRQIAQALNDRGVNTARGGRWGQQTVANVIRHAESAL